MREPVEHRPVLVDSCLDLLRPRPGGRFIDCTVNGAGHSLALLERTAPHGPLLAMDADPEAIRYADQRLAPFRLRVHLVQANFRRLREVAAAAGFSQVDGILMDLGVSSLQLGAPDRGFAFTHDGPLDMRYDPSSRPTAADLLASASAESLERTLREYGQEPRARRIAQAIVAARRAAPIVRTGALAALVSWAVGSRRGRIHPATRTFQALRIAVNDELDALSEALPQAIELLRRGARLAVISFHSLEDRLVKTAFATLAGRRIGEAASRLPVRPSPPPALVQIITPRPVTPSAEERAANPRSRSARLRVAERL